jgi:nitroreductase
MKIPFDSETDLVSISKTGFAGELLVLMAQSLGIATCWYGHYHTAELHRLIPSLQGPEPSN